MKPDWPDHLEVEVITLGETTIYINYSWQIVRTSYPDGTFMELWMMGVNPEDAKRWAGEFGYEVPWEYFKEHELVHTWLSIKMGYPHSPTLWSVAHDNTHIYGKLTRKSQGIEEWLVTKFQGFLNTGERDEYPLRWLEERGLDLSVLRSDALAFLRGHRPSDPAIHQGRRTASTELL